MGWDEVRREKREERREKREERREKRCDEKMRDKVYTDSRIES